MAGDVEPLFPNMPIPRKQDPLEIPRLDRRLDSRPQLDRRQTQIDRYTPASQIDRYRQEERDDWVERALISERRGRKAAWMIACLLIFVCCVQAAAIAIMLPLKEVVPYTVLVDKQTGYVETARGVQLGALAEDQAVVESMLAQYVLARETFDPADFKERYERVALWSLGPARDQYVNQFQSGSADSILGSVRPGTTVKVAVKNIELLTDGTARVRFETQRRDANAQPVVSDWQTIVSFQFTGQPMKNEDRLLNPLGFQVTGYRRDSEMTLANAPAAPADAIPTQSSLAQQPPIRANSAGAPPAPAEGAKQ
ncbi:MAG TPA: type IV secretion system protein [Hyphomonadaceae bacterium]|jgi:type IV secretion system protein VirB8